MSLTLFLTCGTAAGAQAPCPSTPDATKANKFRYTFLWDVTLSMYGMRMTSSGLAPALQSPDIYDQVEATLVSQIGKLDDPTAEIVVIPFQEHALVADVIDEWRVPATREGRDEIISKIKSSKQLFQDNIVKKNTSFDPSGPGTNILGSLQWTTDNIFDDRVDVLFLLTDGGQGGGNVKTGKADLERYLNGDWEGFAKRRNVQGYYLLLTQSAIEGAPDVTGNSQISVVDVSDLSFPVPTNIAINTSKTLNVKDDYEKKSFNLGYEVLNNGVLPEGSKLRVTVESNSVIEINGEVEFGQSGLSIPYRFKQDKSDLRRSLPEEMVLTVKLAYSCDDETDQLFTTLSHNSLCLKLINKVQPAISISWQ